MKIVISTGTRVIERREARTIADVLVKASGRNIRPSCASSRNTGTNDTMMMASEKKIARATCFAAVRIARGCWPYGTGPDWPAVATSTVCSGSDTCRYAFSTMTIDASTSTPIASASPPSDMMLEFTPR